MIYDIIAGQTKSIPIAVPDSAAPTTARINPTIVAADFTISVNGAAWNALTNTPTVAPAGSDQIVVVLSAAETAAAGAGGFITLRAYDFDQASGWLGGIWWLPVVGTATSTLTAPGVWSEPSRTVTGGTVGSAGSVSSAVIVGTNNDKTGYSLSAAGVQAIWDALTTALTTVNSVGKRIADFLDATVSSRSTVTPAQVNAEADLALADVGLTSTVTGRIDATVSSRSTIAAADVWAHGTRTLSSFGTLIADIWANATRTITGGTVTTVGDKSGYSLSGSQTFSTSGSIASVSGSVNSITNPVTVGTNNDKSGYGLSAAGVQAIWDALTPALTTANSVGKRIADFLDATISSRLPTASYSAAPSAATIRADLDANSTKLANLDATMSSRAAAATALSTATWTPSRAAALDNLDATMTSRASASQLTAVQTALTASITAINAATAGDVAATQTAIINAITALNNLSQAQAQSAAAAALGAYDPPTHAELTTALAGVPNTDAIVTAVMTHAISTGKSVEQVLLNLWSVVVGTSVANDGEVPTNIVYRDPSGATNVTHALTDSMRTVL